MQIRYAVRGGALVSSLALVALSGSPALAAEPVARASASGLTLTVAGNAGGTGTYAVTDDGNGETSTGTNEPALAALGNQSFVSAGALAQEARTFVSNGTGIADACAGLAGQGASVAAAGSGTCLSGGDALSLSPTDVDLDKIFAVTLVQGQFASSINGLLSQVPGAADPTAQVTAALQDQIDTLLAPLAGSGLVIGAGAIQSVCTANDSSASGTADIADAGAYLNLPAFGGQPAREIALANFPANPAPNTEVVVGLDQVLDTLVEGLKTSFQTSADTSGPLQAALGPLNTLGQTALTQVQDQLIDTAVAQISSQLAPVQENLLNITLNKQSSTAPNQITVTALDLTVGPDVPQAGGRVLTAQIGTSSCGPNGRVVAPVVAAPPPAATPVKKTTKVKPAPRTPQVPTSVPAGLADAPSRNQPLGGWALGGLGGLMALSVGAGARAYRRSQTGS